MDDRGRIFEPALTALIERDDSDIVLRAPAVGLWRSAPRQGTLVRPGSELGELEVLGVLHQLLAPRGAYGVVAEAGTSAVVAKTPVGYGDLLLRLDTGQTLAEDAEAPEQVGQTGPGGGILFTAPTSGRFYGRPDPDMPPFVAVGDAIKTGQTICLLEVMKTFNRVTYGGEGMPEHATIKAIFPEDGQDLSAGDPIIELEVSGA